MESIRLNKKKAALLIASFFIIEVIVIVALSGRIAITVTPSVPSRVFYLGEPKVQKDGYIYFMINDSYLHAKAVKRIACVSGEDLRVEGRDYFCGSRHLGTAKEFTKKGRRLNQFIYNGKVPEGKYFVAGSHKDSYDSRYWGFLDEKAIINSAYPIF
jgi:type IV secretory pathway protease TraF